MQNGSVTYEFAPPLAVGSCLFRAPRLVVVTDAWRVLQTSRAVGPSRVPRAGALAPAPKDDPDVKRVTTKLRESLEGHGDIVHAAAFSPDGKFLAFARRIGQSGKADLVVAPVSTGEVRRLGSRDGARGHHRSAAAV